MKAAFRVIGWTLGGSIVGTLLALGLLMIFPIKGFLVGMCIGCVFSITGVVIGGLIGMNKEMTRR